MALARAFGCHAVRPGSLDQLAESVNRQLRQAGI